MQPRYSNQAQKEVRWLIEQSGLTAVLTRPQSSSDTKFFGANETSETTIGTIAVEMKDLPPKDLTELGADAVAHVLADSGVQEEDFLAIDGTRYRATAVKPHNFFGAISHLELHMTLERRDG